MGTYALTGSASGIGAALKSALLAEGHNLITIDIKDADIIADLTTPEGRSEVVGKVLELAPGTHYMLTKRALNYWMRRNVMDYGREGIRMNAVAPGPTITPMTGPLFESEEYAPVMQALLDQTPVNRATEAEEIASCIQFLLSTAASNVYGTLLFVDGGYDAHTRPDHV